MLVTSYMAIIGFLSGLYALWISDSSRRQNLTIDISDEFPDWYKITNHSLRPIPIQKVVLLIKGNSGFKPSLESPTIRGITLPGSLAPEFSFEVDWASTRQVVEMIFGGETMLEVHTQTGNVIRSRKTKIRKKKKPMNFRIW
jgi:hypothetical protein